MLFFEYRPPEESFDPPFTIEDVLRSLQEIMMTYHVDFDEALRYARAQGLAFAAFLDLRDIQGVLQQWVQKIHQERRKIFKIWNLAETEKKRRFEEEAVEKKLLQLLSDSQKHDWSKAKAMASSSTPLFLLSFQTRFPDLSPKSLETLENLLQLARQKEDLAFLKRFPFSGRALLSPRETEKIRKRLEGLEELERQLQEAAQNGNLSQLDFKLIKRLFGEKHAQEFHALQKAIEDRFKDALTQSGQVEHDEENDLYKLTPGAARKIGDRLLAQVFADLHADASGRHLSPKESAQETAVSLAAGTRPMEAGDAWHQVDWVETFLEAFRRHAQAPSKTPFRFHRSDFQVAPSRGTAQAAVVLLIDRSGSMSRFGRFFNAKKLALAWEALIRKSFPDDRLFLFSFATRVEKIAFRDVPALAPKPVTLIGERIHWRISLAELHSPSTVFIPEHFTNLPQALEIARKILSAERTENKHIFLVTDGVPTAYREGDFLVLTYPPTQKTFEAALREAEALSREGIQLTTFWLAQEFDEGFFQEDLFLEKIHKITRGRLFRSVPEKLTQYVLKDYLHKKKKIFQI